MTASTSLNILITGSSSGFGNLVWGVVLGIAHWLVVGWMFIFAPKVHAGMKAGMVKEAGPYMLNALGVMGFIAGLVGHIVFGVIVAVVYAWLGGSFGQVF